MAVGRRHAASRGWRQEDIGGPCRVANQPLAFNVSIRRSQAPRAASVFGATAFSFHTCTGQRPWLHIWASYLVGTLDTAPARSPVSPRRRCSACGTSDCTLP